MHFLDQAGKRESLSSRQEDASGGGVHPREEEAGRVGPEAVTPGESEHIGGRNHPFTSHVNQTPAGESDTGGAAGGVSGSALGNPPSAGPGAGGSDLGGVGGTGGGTGGGGGLTGLGTISTGAGTDLGGRLDSG